MKVAVVGAGVIGTGVAYSCLRAGHEVTLLDRPGKDWESVHAAMRHHHRLSLITEPRGRRVDLARLTCSHDFAEVAMVELIVENVTETWEAKREVYASLRLAGADRSFIAANTSAIPIDRLAREASDPGRVVGVHFMNPVPVIDMVEVVRGPQTSVETLDAVGAFLTGMGKRAVVVNDAPGFVINRILMVMVNQAAQLADEGIASPSDIDLLFKGCLGHRMGPLRTADLIGIDTVVNTLDVLREATGDAVFTPAGRLLAMVGTRSLGMKTGRGFFNYGTEDDSD
ncbi:3-hydroxyacyl-CoA dehydrogenase family protein [Mesorhizobium sp. M6A.T.Ce.TU.016.01.1.1]|uniref:3-hydroxyacyl-CoA dehydrogenase family protein n=1 Tax=Mesorhizobium sp. M6A.T.Ce.TU.016.01.1.1 TaxID=2496783 RepID=UPI00163D3899|nr:3-hydroxyacyl-CoA dehydrogenase family protein [Mesorhizobium sp. M6A.T.Ce.TU.016.01.1.1]